MLLPIEGLLGLDGLAGRLANPNYAGKAPPEVVAECQANLAEAEAQAEMGHRWHLLEGPMSAPTIPVSLSP